ncbi:hypothetical protein T492DRAFT_956407 [Pavlovales sp. CCMP2436]|nr:hypothetical protein T492DRAFT_956407 [Pavlovales sp. CCMP2436]
MLAKLCTRAALVVLLAIVAAPLYLSHVAGGWMAKYTSPAPFAVGSIPRLDGRVAIVTGGNSGIGRETARELARAGATVILTARSADKGAAAVANIRASVPTASVRAMALDLSSLASVGRFAAEFERLRLPLHLLVLNAGVMKSPGPQFVGREFSYGFELTRDGFESHIGVNHLAHQALFHKLEGKLRASAPARVVSVSSAAESQAYAEGMRFEMWEQKGSDYEDGKAYGQSKLANIFFAREAASRLAGSGVTAYACHPGIIKTELSRYLAGQMATEAAAAGKAVELANAFAMQLMDFALMTASDGALTQLYLATSAQLPVNGGYYVPMAMKAEPIHPQASNATLQKLFWEKSKAAISKHLRI